jgi:hypothetical protein
LSPPKRISAKAEPITVVRIMMGFAYAQPILRLPPMSTGKFLSMGVVPMPPRLPRILHQIHRQAIDSLLSMDALFV